MQQELKHSQNADIKEKLLADILRKGDEVRLSRRLQLERHQERLELNISKVKCNHPFSPQVKNEKHHRLRKSTHMQ